jgi:spermidine synthase
MLAGVVVTACWPLLRTGSFAAEAPRENFAGRLEYEAASDFSRVRIRKRGAIRSMLFVRDTGQEVLETQLDLRRPHELQFEYMRFLFTSYLVRDPQEDVLIIGLGGGGMIHFLTHLDPGIRIDAVEIDPLVVRLADEFFGVRAGGNLNIVTADGVKFIADGEKKYDAIYMDAFLKPSPDTDDTGAPLSLRTSRFYQQIQQRLKPGGVAAFNLNPHDGLADDIRAIDDAFPQTYVFPLTKYAGAVVIASTAEERISATELSKRGRALDRRLKSSMEFEAMARRVRR